MNNRISSNLLFTIVVFLVMQCGNGNSGNQNGEAQTQKQVLEVVRVQRGVLLERIESSGVVQGINEVFVVAKTQGTIQSVHFELGDNVKKGAILVRIDDQAATYNLREAREQLQTARMQLEAVQKLYEQEAASESELSNAKSQYNRARALFEAAQEGYNNARIDAPIGGSIAQKEPIVVQGNYVSPGARIARIVDLSRIRIEVPLGESEVTMVDTGLPARIVPYNGCPRDSQITGTISAIAAGADPATGSFTTVIIADNTCEPIIKSGMTVTTIIETAISDSGIIIPTSALVDSVSVYVFNKGEVQERTIVPGETNGNLTEVRSGLKAGEYVVITPPPTLESGDKVDTAFVGDSNVWE